MAGKMNFKNLYEKSSKEIQQTIIRMWEEYAPNMVEAYRNQLEDILKDNISSNIVVEDMSNWESTDKNWRAVVNENIWRKWINKDADKSDDSNIVPIKSNPYKHQYESWSKLLKESKSIVVTSGTGSGKTECFMIPLIHDLVYEQDVNREDAVEAIFLYPLNALMEDQRERMSNYIRFSQSCNIEGKKNITFAVYNGNTPENIVSGELLYNEIGTRDEIRRKKPNILFTNPSMLEYMLLRKKDQGLFTKNLKWIVIDEAHTYSGSAGAELALLLKRVLLACGNPNVKFATSSATIGNDDSLLKQFIADITGQDTSQIEIIKGKRTEPKSLPEDKKQLLHNENFVLLNQLFPEGTVAEKLDNLDNLTEQELKARLHYFVKALTAGLYIDLTQDLTSDGKFKLLTGIPLVNGKLDPHPLSAYYCSQCGAILGYGVLGENNTYTRDIKELSTLDCEDSEIDGDDGDGNNSFLQGASGTGKFFIGIASDASIGTRANVDGNRLNDCFDNNGKYVYSEMKKKDGKDISECPCCGANGAHKASPLHSFHLSADFIGRLIAPILLDQTCEVENNNKVLPRQGRKYITFADSRQSAAGPTLKQNLETEEVWVTGVLYKKLLDVQPLTVEEYRKLNSERTILEEGSMFGTLTNEETNKLEYINSRIANTRGYLTWHDAMNALLEDSNCERMCLAFANNNKEEKTNQLKRKYVLSALYRTMNKRPARGKNSPENWGLICTHYPDIEKLNEENIPDKVKAFNNLINSEENKIDSRDWHNFVKLFIDYNIRSNQSVFFKLYEERNSLPVNDEWKEIDIDDIRNYRTEEGSRRQIKHSKLTPSGDRFVKLLCRLLGKDGVGDLTNNEKSAIDGVLAALWDALRTNQIAEESQKIIWNWKNKERKFERWSRSTRDDDFYMNLTRIAFKLYDENIQFDEYLKIPLDTTFKGYSPYSGGDDKYNIECAKKVWKRLSPNNAPLNVKEWFDANRADIAHRWTMKLERILEYICSGEDRNTLYIQAEHTAQVARSVVKQKVEKFKNGELNIMACSTTMEMGVDLGDLELVVMNNVPPQPANYKQRAGRAGRGDQNKSASVTLCGGDAIGETLLKNPLDGFIQRMVAPPKIDLGRASHQLIQRHINSMLLREFAKTSDIGISCGRDGEDDKGWKICDLFTCYSLENVRNPNKNDKTYIRVKDVSNGGSIVFPRDYKDLINDNIHTQSSLHAFLDQLDEWIKNDDGVKNAVKELVCGTALEGRDSIALIQDTRNSILAIANDIHNELSTIKDDWKTDFEHNSNPTTKEGCSLYWQFANVLNTNLLTYLSNHQFTPNANMPSNIVEMILKEKESFWDKTENPTRDLRTALSEYAPGRLVFVDGRTYRMGGVNWNKKRSSQHIKCCAQGHTWMGAANQCPTCGNDSENWPHFGRTIHMITPTGYYPSSDVSRITEKEAMNVEIGVELIGVGNWEENKTHKLYALRTNKDAHNSHIVYYDKGLGFGYHICKKCGYAVPAPMLWDGKEDNLINLMYSPISYIDGQTGRKEEYYQHNYRYECKMDDNNPCDNIVRNIVLGGAIQTDYCEIALYDHRALNLLRMQSDEDTKKIVHTLGVLLCSELSRKIGFDRGELDFVVRTQNSEVSLCIFDVAKGGSGRAKLLPELISELLDNARNILSGCESVQQILDRNTMRYAEYIDIEGAKAWLNKEYETRTIIPADFPANSQNSSYFEIANAIQHTTNADNVYLFVNNDFANWNYDGDGENDDPCWKNCREDMKPRGNNKYNLVIINAPDIVPAADSVVLNKLKESMHLKSATWNNDVYKPLAIVGDVLYVTNVDDYTFVDNKWAADSVWRCKLNQIDMKISDWVYRTDADYMDCIEIQPYTKSTTKHFIELLECDAIKTFQQSANDCNSLTIEYSDRFLCAQLGMIITHQLINNIINKVGDPRYSIKYNINIEEKNDDYGKDIDSDDRSLTDSIRKSQLVEYMQALVNPNGLSNIEITGCSHSDLNHDRSLVVKSDRGHTLIIRPDGGFCRGWYYDKYTARINGESYDTECGIGDDIPIYSKPNDNRYLYYVIYKRPTRN